MSQKIVSGFKAAQKRSRQHDQAQLADPVGDIGDLKSLVLQNASIQGPLTDTSFLVAASHATLSLDFPAFENLLRDKLEDLEERAQSFSDVRFSNHRFFAWCQSVNKTAGHFNVANKHFLENKGRILDDADYVTRFVALAGNGLSELDRRFDRDVRGPADWVRALDGEDARARRTLSAALNYLGRYAYTFNFRDVYEGAVKPVIAERYDVTMYMGAAARLPFTCGDSIVLARQNACVDELLRFLDTSQPGNFTTLSAKDLVFSRSLVKLVPILVSAFENLGRQADTMAFIDHFELSIEELEEKGFLNIFFPFLVARYPDLDRLRELVRKRQSVPESLNNILYRTQINARMGRINKARQILQKALDIELSSFAEISKLARVIESLLPAETQTRFIARAREDILQMSRDPKVLGNENFVSRLADLDKLGREAQVFKEYNDTVDYFCRNGALKPDTAGPAIGKGENIVLFTMGQDRVSPVIMAPLMPILQKNGLRFFNLASDGMTNKVVRPWSASPRLSMSFEALAATELEKNALLQDWHVDPDNKSISCLGVNYYEGFYERISRVLKVYTLDWSLPHVTHFLSLWLRQADRVISALEGARKVLEEQQAHATLVSLQSQFAPYYVLKQYADAHRHCFSHVTISSKYENWASNMSGKPVSSLTLLNNTTNPQPSAPAFGRTDHFKDWVATEFRQNQEHYLGITRKMTGVARAGQASAEAGTFLSWLKEQKAGTNRRVFCALGKIPYDLAVPYQGGPAHSDIKDWLNHTIDTLSETNDLLLIKPHPHELNYEISHKPNERFIDLISRKDDLPDNVKILPYRGISVQDLIPLTDHFLCWNGSSITELGAQGASVLAADDWARKNYPVDVLLPRDRAHFTAMLRGEAPIEMSPQFAALCAAYIPYMVEAPFAIAYPFVGRSPTNTNFNQAWINWSLLTPGKFRELETHAPVIAAAFLGHRTPTSLGSG